MEKDLPKKLLRELLKNSKRSDRELAKILKVSQPTITRARHRLEKSGMIRDYTIIPDFRRMGFEILALTFVKMSPQAITPESIEEAKKYAAKFPNAIFSSTGEGMSMSGLVISFHKDYTDYARKLHLLRDDWKDFVQNIQSFIVSLEEEELKRFSLTYLGDTPL